MIKIIKNFIYIFILFSFNIVAYSSDTDISELNVGGSSLLELEETPDTKFRKSHIKLIGLSEKKFFNDTMRSDPAKYKKSICAKLLSAIEEGYVDKVECTYKGKALANLKEYMYVLARQNPVLKINTLDRMQKIYWLDGLLQGGHVPLNARYETRINRRIIVIEDGKLNEASAEFLEEQRLLRRHQMLEEAEKREERSRDREDRREEMGTAGYNIMNAIDPFYEGN